MNHSNTIITFSAGIILLSTTICDSVLADNMCDTALKSGAFNTEDFARSSSLYLKKRDDVCKMEYSSEAEATESARSSGGNFGYGGFSIGASDAKKTANGKYSIKDSKYCHVSAEEISSLTSESMKKQVADIALAAWSKCIDTTQANKLYVQYTPIPGGTGITGTVIRKVGTGGFGEITGITSSNSDEKAPPITCKIGTKIIKTDEPVTIKFEKTKTSFSCTKDPSRNELIALTTNQDDQDWIFLPSIEQQKINTIESLNDSITALKSKITSVEENLRNIDVQSGTFPITAKGTRALQDNSKCPANSDAYRGETNGRLEFPHPFSTPPQVLVALSELDVSGSGPADSNIRLAVKVISTDTKGFNYQFITWCTTMVYGAAASWTATAK